MEIIATEASCSEGVCVGGCMQYCFLTGDDAFAGNAVTAALITWATQPVELLQ
jgi:hypothetical protein